MALDRRGHPLRLHNLRLLKSLTVSGLSLHPFWLDFFHLWLRLLLNYYWFHSLLWNYYGLRPKLLLTWLPYYRFIARSSNHLLWRLSQANRLANCNFKLLSLKLSIINVTVAIQKSSFETLQLSVQRFFLQSLIPLGHRFYHGHVIFDSAVAL